MFSGSPWRTMDASERGRLMLKLTELMKRDREYIAKLDTVDNGKTFNDAKGDVDQSISTLEYFAGWADKVHGDTIPADGNVMTYTRKEPVGWWDRSSPGTIPWPCSPGSGPPPSLLAAPSSSNQRRPRPCPRCTWPSWPGRPGSRPASSTWSLATVTQRGPPWPATWT